MIKIKAQGPVTNFKADCPVCKVHRIFHINSSGDGTGVCLGCGVLFAIPVLGKLEEERKKKK